MYNETIKRLKLAEGAGEIFVIRPSKHIDIKKLENLIHKNFKVFMTLV